VGSDPKRREAPPPQRAFGVGSDPKRNAISSVKKRAPVASAGQSSRTVDAVPRPPRIQVAGGLYHITTQANFGRLVFQDDRERAHFLEVLTTVVRRHSWSCRDYCLLSTHYHVFVETPDPDIAEGMQYLNGRYAQWANKKRGERSHVFADRYASVQVKTGSHALEIHRYIALNPVRAGLVREPEDWPWSSLPALLGRERPPAFLDVNGALGLFGSTTSTARRRLRMFIRDGLARDRA
jgi:REP-associated tyrosine transposase